MIYEIIKEIERRRGDDEAVGTGYATTTIPLDTVSDKPEKGVCVSMEWGCVGDCDVGGQWVIVMWGGDQWMIVVCVWGGQCVFLMYWRTASCNCVTIVKTGINPVCHFRGSGTCLQS